MTLTIYLTRVIALRVLAAALVLLLLGLSLDLLKSATDLLEEGGAHALFVYAALRAPLIMATLFPIAVLTGGVLGFLILSRRSEMIVIRAMGRSVFATLKLLIPCAVLLGVTYHLLDDRIAPWSEELLSITFPKSTDAAEVGAEIWSRAPDEVIHARLASADGTALSEITFWRLDADGQITARATAEGARYDRGRWLLDGFIPDAAVEATAIEAPWETRLTPAVARALAVGALAVSTATAQDVLTGAAVSTRGAAYYETLIAHSYVAFFIPAVMLLLAAAASFGTNRGGGAIARAALVIVAGFVYVVIDGVLGTLSEVGAMDAVLASVFPTVLFALLGLWSLILLEER